MKVKVKDKVVDINTETTLEEIQKLTAEYRAIKIEELKQKLADTDYVIIKIAEGSATAEEYADVIKERKAWREEINKLEAECS
jgi:hypothetical protein